MCSEDWTDRAAAVVAVCLPCDAVQNDFDGGGVEITQDVTVLGNCDATSTTPIEAQKMPDAFRRIALICNCSSLIYNSSQSNPDTDLLII